MINQGYIDQLANEKIMELNRRRTEEKFQMFQSFFLKLDYGEMKELQKNISAIQNYLLDKIKKFN